MKYKNYVGKLYYRVVGKYPEKKIMVVGKCIHRENTPEYPYVWAEYENNPDMPKELIGVPFDPSESHTINFTTTPCTEKEIEEIFASIFNEEYALDLPINEVTQSTEIGYYFDMKQN